jgi:hypothetical protein
MISGERCCWCCGRSENLGGCVLGPRCGCEHMPQCEVCKHCLDHHVEGCTQAVRMEAIQLIASLRERHGINMFDYGARTYEKEKALRDAGDNLMHCKFRLLAAADALTEGEKTDG